MLVASVEDVALDEASAGAGFILPGGRGTDPFMDLVMDPYRQE